MRVSTIAIATILQLAAAESEVEFGRQVQYEQEYNEPTSVGVPLRKRSGSKRRTMQPETTPAPEGEETNLAPETEGPTCPFCTDGLANPDLVLAAADGSTPTCAETASLVATLSEDDPLCDGLLPAETLCCPPGVPVQELPATTAATEAAAVEITAAAVETTAFATVPAVTASPTEAPETTAAATEAPEKKSKSGKGSKAKSGKSSPSDDNMTELEKRFGPQMSPEDIDMIFDMANDVTVMTEGLQNYETPDFSINMVDNFYSGGRLVLSWEEVQSVCVTKCSNNPACMAVAVADLLTASGIKNRYDCKMFNPELGDGSYQFDNPPGWPRQAVLYTKKSSPEQIAPYEPCQVIEANLVEEIGCFLTCSSNPDDPICEGCYPSLTDDFMDYMAPAILCVLQEGAAALGGMGEGAAFLNSCLECLSNDAGVIANNSGSSKMCSTDPSTSTIRGLGCGNCGSKCYHITDSTTLSESCEKKLQSSLLCATGSIPSRVDTPNGPGYTGGLVNQPYMCPEADSLFVKD